MPTKTDDDLQDLPSLATEAAITVVDYASGEAHSGTRPLAVEAPVNLVYGSMPHAVMMTTPGDLEDFAYGFSLTEGIVEEAGEIREVRVESVADGLRLLVELSPGRLREHLARKRAISGRTGCGVCGIEDLAALPRAALRPAPDLRLAVPAIAKALGALDEAQRLGALTRAVHAAAWADLDGNLVAVREDVGRHNALDKLIGALMRAGTDPAEGFLITTGARSRWWKKPLGSVLGRSWQSRPRLPSPWNGREPTASRSAPSRGPTP